MPSTVLKSLTSVDLVTKVLWNHPKTHSLKIIVYSPECVGQTLVARAWAQLERFSYLKVSCSWIWVWASSSLGAFQVALVVKNSPANAGDIRNVGSIPGLERSPGGGYGNLLQYSCLENPIDRGAWRATVHLVTKSQTWQKLLSTQATVGWSMLGPCEVVFFCSSISNLL